MFALALGVGIALSVVLPSLRRPRRLRLADLVPRERGRAVLPPGRSADSSRRRGATPRWSGRPCGAAASARCSDRTYRARFVLLGLVAFVTNVFIAPSSQLTNRYLTRAHDFSNSDVAGFRTRDRSGCPGSSASSSRDDSPRAAAAARSRSSACWSRPASRWLFFVASDDALLWIAPTIAIVAAASAGPRARAPSTPSSSRPRSAGRRTVSCSSRASPVRRSVSCSRPSSATRWAGSGPRSRSAGSRRSSPRSLLVPRLPETVARRLDDVSPTETVRDEVSCRTSSS